MRPADLAAIARIRADLASGAAGAARRAAGVKAAEIAAAAGVCRQTVYAWEAGRLVPAAPRALAYARALAAVTSALPPAPARPAA
jgi:DNA-binding XRE family transcriptional regulator